MKRHPTPQDKTSLDSKLARFGTLALLYFVQGAPYGFQTACLPLILRKTGLSFSSLGAMKLLFLPWVCKPLYAPLIERSKSKLWWLVSSMLVLGLTCICAAFTSEDMLAVLAFILFMLNLASATQDICVDSLALKILRPDELGAGNTIQVMAYKAGSVFAGGSLLWVRDLTNWSVMWIIFGSLYLICICLVCGLRLVSSEERAVPRPGEPLNPVRENLSSIFMVDGTRWMVGFVLFYKLCERGEGTLPIFLVDKGVPISKLAFWTGIVRSAASLTGSSLGGFLLSAKKLSPRTVLNQAAVLRCFPIFLQFILISAWGTQPITSADTLEDFSFDSLMFYMAIISLCLANFCAGVLTTACFTAMMSLSQTAPERIQSSHYSLLATMEVLGKLAFASISGWLIDLYGLDSIFVIFVVFSVLTVPLLWSMPVPMLKAGKQDPGRAKKEEDCHQPH
eukprot:TRINITY_DN20262_c0_g1_i1.p1 TRINITY_DN20262_c0_g1~~TRINITY_DN20262_c0_g1_i1.p1  ORF type:complete len:451 (-),score=116.56 TRINITY_DN20262_c0_g1_i1:174-1526(-)